MLTWSRDCVFFFFQAEDGIRDIGVTGVQTCALPIFAVHLGIRIGLVTGPGGGVEQIIVNQADPNTEVDGERASLKTKHPFRSEERRVGKERRTRREGCTSKRKVKKIT